MIFQKKLEPFNAVGNVSDEKILALEKVPDEGFQISVVIEQKDFFKTVLHKWNGG